MRNGTDLFILHGHMESVFRTDKTGSVLFFAAFGRSGSGCTLLAYDLGTGKELWKTRRDLLKVRERTGYSNELNLRIGPEIISVYGHESNGDYIEVFHQRTGRCLAHKVYRDIRQINKKGNELFFNPFGAVPQTSEKRPGKHLEVAE